MNVVISSNWREAHTLRELRQFFAPDLWSRVLDKLPVIRGLDDEAEPRRFQRESEVLDWLRLRGELEAAWVALDDDPSLFRRGCERLVVCDGSVGIT